MIIRTVFVLSQVLILYLMQTSVFPAIALAGVVPNLLLILVVSIGFMRGRIPAMLTGFACGLLIDCSYSGFVGLFALMYVVIGYLSGLSHKIYDENDTTLPLLLVGIGELLYNLMYYILFFFLDGKLNIGYYLFRFGIARIIYTVLVSILLYKFLNLCNGFFVARVDKD